MMPDGAMWDVATATWLYGGLTAWLGLLMLAGLVQIIRLRRRG